MSPVRGVVGVANYGKNDFYNTPEWKHTTASEFSVDGVTKLPRVDIVFACADMSPDLIDASVANGAKGIVIAGVGNGNMNKASLAAAANAAKKGVVVVRSSRVATGSVGRNVEVNDDELGFIASESRPYCGECSRLRLSATGVLRSCLMSERGASLRSVLPSDYDAILPSVLAMKPGGRIHHVDQAMHEIGG
jgi:hypothetical protein